MSSAGSTGRRWWRSIGAVVVALAVAGGVAIWYFVFRDTAPPATDIDVAARSVEPSTGMTSPSGVGGLDGTWTVDRTVGHFDVGAQTFTGTWVGYRVKEELVGIGAKTAVGRTPQVTGSLAIAGTAITKVEITADLSRLESDDSQRDNAIRMQALETRRFPQASFALTQPIELGSLPAEGQTVQVKATGTLTLHGVTKPVTIGLEAKKVASTIVVTGALDIAFADYSIARPSSFKVLSVEDRGVLELQLFFAKAS